MLVAVSPAGILVVVERLRCAIQLDSDATRSTAKIIHTQRETEPRHLLYHAEHERLDLYDLSDFWREALKKNSFTQSSQRFTFNTTIDRRRVVELPLPSPRLASRLPSYLTRHQQPTTTTPPT